MKKFNLNEYIILSLYAKDPLYEYAAVDAIQALEKAVNKNTLHSQLSELWSKGYLSRRQEQPMPVNRPPKQFYRITVEGLDRLRTMKILWEQYSSCVDLLQNHEAGNGA